MMRRRVVRRAGIGVLGATAIGASAYAMGSHNAHRSEQEADQEARLAQLESSPSYPPPPPQYSAPPQYAPPPPQAPPATNTQDRIEQLKQLAQLKESGVLSPPEFEAEKARILGY